jgi:hypothetical protein
MTLDPLTDLIPSEEELHEPDRLLDQVTSYIRSEPPDSGLAAWFIENLATPFGIPLYPGHRDPIRNLQALADNFLGAMILISHDPRRRKEVTQILLRVLQDLLDQLLHWREEDGDQEELRQKWGLPATPPPHVPFRM